MAIGVLTLACLALLAALMFTAAERIEAPALRLEAPVAATADDAPSADSPGAAVNPAAFPAEPHAIPTTLITALEQAGTEPLEVELERLLGALQHGFGETSVQIEPTLRTYAFRLAGRLNVRPSSFRVRVTAPDGALARARAESLRRLFAAAGVVSGRLAFQPRTGLHSLTIEPT